MDRERIPYKERANSQLSIAKHYWWIKIEWVSYILDYDNCKTMIKDWEVLYFPDLIIQK